MEIRQQNVVAEHLLRLESVSYIFTGSSVAVLGAVNDEAIDVFCYWTKATVWYKVKRILASLRYWS